MRYKVTAKQVLVEAQCCQDDKDQVREERLVLRPGGYSRLPRSVQVVTG